MWIDKGSNFDKANSGIASPSSNELGWETPQQGSAAQTTLCSVECFNPWEEESLSHGDPTVGRYWETDGDILQDKSKQIYDVQGRLKSSQFWVEVLEAKPPVIDWIREGYRLPLVNLPPEFYQANHRSAIDNREYVAETIKDLLKYRCIQVATTRPHICSPLSVVINDRGKKRLVLNLRYLNQYL